MSAVAGVAVREHAGALTGGFADGPAEAARAFRAVMNALARPGRIEALAGVVPPAPMSVAAGVAMLVLADGTTPVHLAPSHDTAAVRDWLRFHIGAPLVPTEAAMFALGDWAGLQPLERFAIGTAEYPDRSATLIVEVAALMPGNAALRGPGIQGSATLALPDPAAFAANHALFPQGCDFFLTAGNLLAGLPRSTIVEAL
ncbi:MAG TPA: phosphonate C-P lyase system protein PhnH [Paracoccaceae bacterium]